MPPLLARPHPRAAIALASLALLAAAGLPPATAAAAAAPSTSAAPAAPADAPEQFRLDPVRPANRKPKQLLASSSWSEFAGGESAQALATARDRSARADAIVDALKSALAPGHLIDPVPDIDRSFGLEGLRADYADLERKAAGYRATMGDRHPTVVGAEQVLGELKAQLLTRTRRALTIAQQEAGAARGDAAAIERRIAERAVDVTGGVAPRAAVDAMPPAPAAAATRALPPVPVAARAPDEARVAPPRRGTALWAAAAVVAGLLALLAARAIRRGVRRPRRVGRAPVRRIEPELAANPAPAAFEPAPSRDGVPSPRRDHAPAPAPAIPVLATLPLPVSADVAVALGRTPDGLLWRAAGDIHATLRAALAAASSGGARASGEARMTVLVSPLDEGSDDDGCAVAIAFAAAAAGRSAVVLEARAGGHLRRTLAPADDACALVEVGGTLRPLYRLEAGGRTVAVLPSDDGEAEAAEAAAGRSGTPLLQGLGGFDTVILVGPALGEASADGAGLARSADIVLLAAPLGATAAELAAAARGLGREGHRCGALLVARTPLAAAVSPQASRARSPARRRTASDPAPAARLGLRGSLKPARRRAGP